MHRLILNAPVGKVVDHRNHNKLDNRRSNIWVCTQRENSQNRMSHGTLLDRKLHPRNRTGHSGIYEYMPGRYRVFVRGKGHGIYESLDAAVEARRELVLHK